MTPVGLAIRALLVWWVAGLLGPVAAMAGELARYRLGDGELTLYFGDPWHVRAELRVGGDAPTVLILNEGRTAVLREGRPVAQGGAPPVPQPLLPGTEAVGQVRGPGREEGHAGFHGSWFTLRLASGSGARVLLSRDPQLRAVRLGWHYLAEALGPRAGLGDFLTLERLLRAPPLSRLGLLQWPGVAVLLEVRRQRLDDDLFSLPR